jgi:DNA-binding NtrC family response regulator
MTICSPKSPPRPAQKERVLVIDDDTSVSECVECILQMSGYRAVFSTSGKAGLENLHKEAFDLVITDLKLPDITGLEVIGGVKEFDSDIPVILMTGFSSIESAIEALRRGAADYIIKPFRNDDFAFAIERAINERRMRKENAVLKRSLKKVYANNRIIGESEGIKRVQTLIQKVAATDANVLIQGESGTGKELVAQAIHFSGHRADNPFIPINCGAIPSDLLESELFGHVKGAFTGAVSANEGLIREAGSGTLFLDEISELPLNLQVKLLRVIQEKQVRPVGSSHNYLTDTRFLAASNRDLKVETENGAFRADLFYRLNVVTIQVPPLRERGKDVEILAHHFLEQHCQKMGKRIRGIGEDLRSFLREYDWPGNVRELENLIERAVIFADSDVLTCSDLSDMLPLLPKGSSETGKPNRPLPIEEYIREFIRLHQDTHSEIELASMLGIGRKALWMRRRRWDLYRDKAGPKDERSPTREKGAA